MIRIVVLTSTISVFMYVNIYVYIYIYTCIHIYTYSVDNATTLNLLRSRNGVIEAVILILVVVAFLEMLQ